MRELFVKVPEEKVPFVMELVNQLGLEAELVLDIAEEDKELVRQRISTTKEEELISWQSAKETFQYKK